MFLLAKYNTQTVFTFPMIKRGVIDFAVTGDWTPASGDTKLWKDGAGIANTSNQPVAVSGTGSALWSLTLTNTELTCAVADIQIIDSATKAVEDQFIKVYTYGNASAKIPADLSDTVRLGLTALPNAAAAASGGLLTVGTGSGQISPTLGSVSTTFAIKKNTALNNFEFPMFQSSDHVTPQGGLTGISGDVSIDGGGFTSLTNTGSISEVGSNTGIYKVNLTQADTNGNTLTFRFIKSGTDTTIIGVITQS